MNIINIGTENEATRDRWVRKTFNKIPKGSKILDAGAGELKYKKFCKHLIYTSQDFAQYESKKVKTGLHPKWGYGKLDIVSDITKIPVKNSYFDAVLCTEVLEHIPEPTKAINEFRRILKKGGKLIITAPFCSLTHFAPYHFYSGFNIFFYRQLLPEYGFKIIEEKTNGNYFSYIAQELRRLPSVSVRYSRINRLSSFFLAALAFPQLFILSFLAKHNKGSDELLCFGYHILAQKL